MPLAHENSTKTKHLPVIPLMNVATEGSYTIMLHISF